MSENVQEPGKKHGCAPLGCLIIIIAIAAVLFYFLAKPALEEHGITVDAMKEKLVNAEEKIDLAGEQAGDKLDQLKQQTKEKMPKIPVKLYQD